LARLGGGFHILVLLVGLTLGHALDAVAGDFLGGDGEGGVSGHFDVVQFLEHLAQCHIAIGEFQLHLGRIHGTDGAAADDDLVAVFQHEDQIEVDGAHVLDVALGDGAQQAAGFGQVQYGNGHDGCSVVENMPDRIVRHAC
jgi:hypothetical protein